MSTRHNLPRRAAGLALAGVVFCLIVSNTDKSVSFTVCGGSVDMFNDGSRQMEIDTSAGRFTVTDPRVIADLGGDIPEIGRVLDARYRGDNVRFVLTKVSSAKAPDRVSPYR